MKMFYRSLWLCCLVLPLPALADKKHPDCTGDGDWPAAMALSHLMHDVVDRYAFDQIIDYDKVKIVRLSSIKIGALKKISKRYDPSVYRQIHHITYYKKSGEVLFEAITDGKAYHFECSGDITVYEIARTFKN